MLERWNDEKMNALEGKVDGLGDQMREQRQETRELWQETRELRNEMKAGFEQMHRTMFNGAITLTSGFLTGFAALIVASS